MEEKKSDNIENNKMLKVLFDKYDSNIVLLTLFFSKNYNILILSSHNLTLYSLNLEPIEPNSLQIIYQIPETHGNALVFLEMQKSNLLLTGHENGSILVFKWGKDRKLVQIKHFHSNYYEKNCLCLLGFQETQFIINSGIKTEFLNILKIHENPTRPKFQYSIKFEKTLKGIQILEDNTVQSFVCSFDDNSIKLYFADLQNKKSPTTKELINYEQIISFTYNNNKKILFGISPASNIIVWDLNEFHILSSIKGQPFSMKFLINEHNPNKLLWKVLDMSSEEINLISYEGSTQLNKINVFRTKPITTLEDSFEGNSNLKGHFRWVKALYHFTTIQNQEIFLTSSEDRTILSWDLKQLTPIDRFKLHFMYIYAILNIKINNEDLIATASGDLKIKIWEWESKNVRAVLKGHEALISCLCFIEKSKHLLSGSNDATIRVWDMLTFENIKILNLHTNRIRNLVFLGNVFCIGRKEFLISSSDDGSLRFWDIVKYETFKKFVEYDENSVRSCHYMKYNGINHLLTSSYPALIRIWNLKTLKCVKAIKLVEKEITTLKFLISQQKAVILVGCASSKIKLVDFFTNAILKEILLENGWTREIKFVPSKSLVLANCWSKDIACWKVKKTINHSDDQMRKKVEIVSKNSDQYIFCIYDGELFYIKMC